MDDRQRAQKEKERQEESDYTISTSPLCVLNEGFSLPEAHSRQKPQRTPLHSIRRHNRPTYGRKKQILNKISTRGKICCFVKM